MPLKVPLHRSPFRLHHRDSQAPAGHLAAVPADRPAGRREQLCQASSLEQPRPPQGPSQAPGQKQVLEEFWAAWKPAWTQMDAEGRLLARGGGEGYNNSTAFSIAKCQTIFSIPEVLKCHAHLDNSRSNCFCLENVRAFRCRRKTMLCSASPSRLKTMARGVGPSLGF